MDEDRDVIRILDEIIETYYGHKGCEDWVWGLLKAQNIVLKAIKERREQ